jgi:ribosomal protein S27E
MAFQFQCPQDHLLEGEESQAGQAINCPVCGMLFIIPEPVAAPEVPAEPEKPPEPEFLHIPCPNGHELEVPPDMLDTEVLCPQCNVQFRLRAKDSIEHKAKRERAEAIQDAKTNKFYYQFAIVVASVVGLLLLSLMIMSAMSKTQGPEKPKGKKKAKPAEVEPPDEPPVERTDGDSMSSDEK